MTLFPVRPVSDFEVLVGLARLMRDVSWTVPSWHWIYLSPGLPLALSFVLRLFPGPPEDVARLATAVVCGLVPLLPFALWRGVVSFRVRLLAGLLLALWPGQVFFSGVVAQDNWVLPPTVALACLATRALARRAAAGRPVLAGLLYALAVAMRQEMLVALLPLLLAGAGLGSREESRENRTLAQAALCALAAGLPLLLLAIQRELATGPLRPHLRARRPRRAGRLRAGRHRQLLGGPLPLHRLRPPLPPLGLPPDAARGRRPRAPRGLAAARLPRRPHRRGGPLPGHSTARPTTSTGAC